MKGQSLPHRETSSAEADLERCAEKALLGVGSDGRLRKVWMSCVFSLLLSQTPEIPST